MSTLNKLHAQCSSEDMNPNAELVFHVDTGQDTADYQIDDVAAADGIMHIYLIKKDKD